MGFWKTIGKILDFVTGPMPVNGSIVKQLGSPDHFGVYYGGRILTTDERGHITVVLEREFGSFRQSSKPYYIAYSKDQPDRNWIVPQQYHDQVHGMIVDCLDGNCPDDSPVINRLFIEHILQDQEEIARFRRDRKNIVWKVRRFD